MYDNTGNALTKLVPYWGGGHDTGALDDDVTRFLSDATIGVLEHPQAIGNHFDYRKAIPMVGLEVDDDTWDKGFSQNLDSAWRLSRAVLRRMTPRGEGSMLLISSIAGLGALGTPLTYGTAKAGMNHLAKELAKMSGPANVRVNVIAPGNIIFPGGTWEASSTGPRGDAWARWIKREVPMNRYGKPEEIGAVAAFLMSSMASFVTGAVIPVDGGQTR